MGTRWVIHQERLEQVRGENLMRRLGEGVETDMKRLVPKDKHVLVQGIELRLVTNDRARVYAIRPGGGGGWGSDQEQYAEEVPYFQEYGTRHHRAQPFMRPALYRRRG
jgi:hypothetical protein